MFKPCIIIPVYNHSALLPETIQSITEKSYSIVMVDDGSDYVCQEVMIGLEKLYKDVFLVRRPCNGGKGAAVKSGLREALKLGFTHALQIDADGQHNQSDIPRFLKTAEKKPSTLVAGIPEYDESVPKGRLYSRYLTHVWVWINTLSFDISDSMCGFRVYPVEQSVALINGAAIGDRMDFDTEFIVRWYWQGYDIEELLTPVIYPDDGVSHFKLWRDNALISWMHTRLFFGMLIRLPKLICWKINNKSSASSI
jgi:glycosyltransferase involved in cell wall biosynthesis